MKDLFPRLKKTGEIRVSFSCKNISGKLDIREKKLSEKTFRAGMANFCILGPN
jgi:hypothetical protein